MLIGLILLFMSGACKMSDHSDCNCDQALRLKRKLKEILSQIEGLEEKTTFQGRQGELPDEWPQLLNYIRRLCREEINNEQH